ncbi:hypothetical protein ACRPLQ_05455 [Priestia sp. TRN 1309]|uniref:hypothetical protein n=1 Tax=Priestia TaxID=2800373 RepID=UPI0013F5BFC6|nr:hypothetical protein [Bacillus sp. MB95]
MKRRTHYKKTVHDSTAGSSYYKSHLVQSSSYHSSDSSSRKKSCSSCHSDPCCCFKGEKTTITLAADQYTVCTQDQGNNTLFLSGQVLVDGKPAAGVIVEFSVNPSLATIIPLATLTNSSGNFTAVFVANDGPGVVLLTAKVLGCDEATASVPISIVNCQSSSANVNIGATPSTVCTVGTGSNISTVSGQVLVNGTATAGVKVNLSVNNPNLGVLNTSTVTTDASGKFSATFTATSETGTVNITASLPEFSGATANTSISINNCRSTASVTLAASPPEICNERGTSNLSGQVLVNGIPTEGVEVDLSVSDPKLGSVTPSVVTTDASGKFSATFTATDESGTVIIKALLPKFSETTTTTSVRIDDC